MKGRLTAALALVGASGFAVQFEANFDSKIEGEFGEQMVDGGIRFHSLDRVPLEPPNNFTIEDASTTPLGSDFSAPNALAFGGYLVGTDTAFHRMKSFEFDIAGGFSVMFSAQLDMWFYNLHAPGNTVTLEGYFEGNLVDFDTYAPSSFSIVHHRFSLPDDNYDRFIVRAEGPVDEGVVFAIADNVRLSGEPVPEPATWLALALGLGLRQRSRRLRA